ncbi:MAG: efflux RND transporter periplasmic adaptor subunit [Proteobacteria bacterium]|nr:efflux RND transporter periplasmic adaptor subunit [Pseudomonadota bacterium]
MTSTTPRLLKYFCFASCLLTVFLSGPLFAAAAEKNKVTKVEVLKLKPRPLTKYASYVGHLKPINRVTVSAEIAGTIDHADFSVGQEIHKGQILVKIDTKRLRLNKEMNESNYTLALMDYNREKSLYIKKLSTLAKVAALKNRLDVNKFRLDLSKLDLTKSEIRAPSSGVVKKKFVEKGEYIGPGKKIVELIDISSVLASVNIPEYEIRFAKMGKKVDVSLDAIPGEFFSGKIKTIGFEADQRSRSFAVEMEMDNPDQELLPGMLVRIRMVTISMKKQVLIPRHAIQEEEKGSFVYIVKNSKTIKRPVKIGLTIKDDVQILSGLRFGEYLVDIGQQLITDQEKVKVLKIRKQTL